MHETETFFLLMVQKAENYKLGNALVHMIIRDKYLVLREGLYILDMAWFIPNE